MYFLDNFVCLCFNFTDPSILNVWKSFQSGLLHHLKMYFVEKCILLLSRAHKSPEASYTHFYSMTGHLILIGFQARLSADTARRGA